MNGLIFDIKEFSIHDGPGIRTTVFMKGCPLKCVWCHNPEGLSTSKQLMYKKSKCTHCRKCFNPCNHSECAEFKRCVHACPNGCLSIAGREISSDELAKTLMENKDFFLDKEGGITISGGEPLMQSEFVCELAKTLGNIHKALQTSGYADCETYKYVTDNFDYIMQDIKLANPNAHKKFTGVDNALILKNIDYLKKSGKKFVFRVPLIPGITDTPENLTEISRIAEDFPVELLRYNPLAGAKYEMLNMPFTLKCQKNRNDDFDKYFKNAVII